MKKLRRIWLDDEEWKELNKRTDEAKFKDKGKVSRYLSFLLSNNIAIIPIGSNLKIVS